MKSTLERAIELAKTGGCSSLEDIRRQLVQENHDAVLTHLAGTSIKRQLNALLKAKADARQRLN